MSEMNEGIERFLNFEEKRHENGMTYWWASDVMDLLDYSNMNSFKKVIDRATKAFISLNIPHHENIVPASKEDQMNIFQDYKLSRF